MVTAGTQYRQGDTLLVAAEHLPAEVEPMPLPSGQPVALATGGTGFGSHLLPRAPALRAYRLAGGQGAAEWLELGERLTLPHPEHAPLTLESGVWRVVRQREFDPAAPGARRHSRVAD